jgi:hypothetical protein
VLNGSFDYIDANGKQFVTTIAPMTAIDFAPVPAQIDKTQALSATWSNGAVESDGMVELIVAEDRNRLNFARAETRNVGATNIVMGIDQLARLPSAAAAIVSLRRWRDFVPQNATALVAK